MADSQQIARRVLADLDSLVSSGKLQAPQLFDIRTQLQPIAHPPAPAVARKPSSVASHNGRKQVRALWSYEGAEDDELSFREGDRIEIVDEVSPDWWKGRVLVGSVGSSSTDKEGLFPSNYVEVVEQRGGDMSPAAPRLPQRAVPPPFSPQAAHSDAGDTLVDEKHGASFGAPYSPPMPTPSWHNSQLGPPKWQPGVARWSSGGPQAPAVPPPPPHSSNHSYYNQPPMPYGGATPAAYGTQQPVVQSEEEKKKSDKFKKMGGRLGTTMAQGFAGGVGFGVGSHLF